MCFHFSSCSGVFLGITMDQRVKGFQMSYDVNRAASCSWENYHMLGEHICITALFLQ
jgi:hypothetical protein